MKVAIVAAIFVLAFAVLACDASMWGTPAPDPLQQFALDLTQGVTVTITPRPTATATPRPTATTGYQATIDAKDAQLAAVQATRDALARLQSDVTLEAGHMTEQVGQWTAEAFGAREQHIHETQTAATPAAIATITRQAHNDALAFTISTGVSIASTATIEAPTQIVAAARAQAEAHNAEGLVAGSVALMIGIGFLALMLGIVVLLKVVVPTLAVMILRVRNGERQEVEVEEKPMPAPLPRPVQPAMQANVNTTYGSGTNYPHVLYGNAPCTEAQLLRLVHGVIVEHRSLAVNEWEMSWANGGIGQAIDRVRVWVVRNGWAYRSKSGRLSLNSDGETWFTAVEQAHRLPSGVRCIAEEPALAVIMDMEHEHGNMESSGGGDLGGLQPVARVEEAE